MVLKKNKKRTKDNTKKQVYLYGIEGDGFMCCYVGKHGYDKFFCAKVNYQKFEPTTLTIMNKI